MNEKANEKITAFYCRWSCNDDVEIEKQKTALIDYAMANSIEKYEFYIDNGYTCYSTNRPSLIKLMTDAEKGRITEIVFTNTARFGQYSRQIDEIIRQFLNCGVVFKSLDEMDTLVFMPLFFSLLEEKEA